VFQHEFKSPPSGLCWQITAITGSTYFKDWSESWLGPDGHHGFLLDGINVDGVQHRHKQLTIFHGSVDSGNDQLGQLVLQGAFSPAVILMGVEAVHAGLAQSKPQLF